jgi:Tfp pilus assembly protein PilW
MLIARLARDERGFTVAELMVASLITMLVLGGAVALTSQIQGSYARQMEDAAAEQEGRYALEWMSRLIRAAGNDPFNMPAGDCPVAGTVFQGIIWDPDGDTIHNDIRLQSDSNPPDALLGGPAGACTQANEDVTISFDPETSSITFLDNNLGGGSSIRTDAVIDNLLFIYMKADGTAAVTADQVVFVEIQVTVRTRTLNAATGLPDTRVLSQVVRVRGRVY